MTYNFKAERIAQIRRELENYSSEQLTEIYRRHNLDEWTEEAFEAIRQILTTRPGVKLPKAADERATGSHLERAHAFAERDQLQEALAEIDLAIEKDPYSLEAHQFRGNLLEKMGDIDAAIQAYRQARYLNPANASTRQDLRRALSKQFENVAWKRKSVEEVEEEIDVDDGDELGESELEDIAPEPDRSISTTTKQVIGLATGWLCVAMVVIGYWIYTHMPELLSGTAISPFQSGNLADQVFLIFTGLVWLGLLGYYLHHLSVNDDLPISLTGLIGTAIIFLPIIGMPFYFLKYIWSSGTDNIG